ncbi:MAG: hypothetical protein IJ381_03965 [Clostridia bacterium]|nr:hypothetical protein [Clostridia bacterium]
MTMTYDLLHVIKAEPSSVEEADALLRFMRRIRPTGRTSHAVLLFCDLPPHHSAVAPHDDAIIRRLQSGTAACESREPGAWMLLVRCRAWSSTERMYLGSAQDTSVEQVLCDLLMQGKTDVSFHAATFSPARLKARFRTVLFSSSGLFCTPDTMKRMHEFMHAASLPIVSARVILPRVFPQTILARLERSGFFPSAAYSVRQHILAQKHFASDDAPRMYDVAQMQRSLHSTDAAIPAEGCAFVRHQTSTLKAMFSAHFRRVLQKKEPFPALPLLQFFLFFLSGCLGLPSLALAALILPEYHSFLHPSLLPSAFIRLALLPVISVITLDALLARLFSRSPYLRLRLPLFLCSPSFCAASGLLLIAVAFSTVHALYILLLPGLLWLSAPLIIPSLSMPTIERIPVNEEEQAQLHALAVSAYSIAHTSPASAARKMLVICCGAMLGILEADEAGRQVQRLLAQVSHTHSLPDPVDQACMLCCAQYLREHMEQCDAALRPLPGLLEQYLLSLPPPPGEDALSLLIQAAHNCDSVRSISRTGSTAELRVLFLPLRSARETAKDRLTLPFTHPHTFLKQFHPSENTAVHDPAGFFLALSAASLSHPFYALLFRSPITGPYMPLLSLPPLDSPKSKAAL